MEGGGKRVEKDNEKIFTEQVPCVEDSLFLLTILAFGGFQFFMFCSFLP